MALHILDVGQGLAVMIETENHVLLYDTGSQWDEGDAGGRFILPFIDYKRLSKLDLIALSHFDKDHRGGLSSILEAFPHTPVITPVLPVDLSKEQLMGILSPHSICAKGKKWDWDGVHFEFLFPGNQENYRSNLSCVLKVVSENYSVLLTGDIEKEMEEVLMHNADQLQADILVVPHHGSLTSSSTGFINQVKPTWAIFSAGFNNPFSHPHPHIVKRYQNRQIKTLITSETGSIHFSWHDEKKKIVQQTYRKDFGRFWHRY